MNTDKHRFKASSLVRASVGLAACATLFLSSGCTYSLHPRNTPSWQALKIDTANPQKILVRVEDVFGQSRKDYVIGEDGIVRFEVPSLPSGCVVRLFGLIKIADSKSEDVRAIHLVAGEKSILNLSLNRISKLPANSDGVRVLKIK